LRTVSPTVAIKSFAGNADRQTATDLAKRTKAQYAIFGTLVGSAKDSVRFRVSLVDLAKDKVDDLDGRDSTAEAAAGRITVWALEVLGRSHRIGATRKSSFGSTSIDAMRAFQRAVELQPDNEDAAAKLSEIFLMAYTSDAKHPPHFLKEIEDNTKKILDKNPKSYDGLRLRGYLYLLRKDLPHAVEDFKLANSLKPNQADLMLVLAQSYIADKKVPEAEALAKQGIEGNKEYFPLYNLLAQVYMQTNRPQQAEELLKLKASNNPRNATPLVELAAFYWTQNRKPEAEAQLNRLTSNVKDFPAAHALAGDFHFRFREYDKAVDQYRKGFQQTPDAAQKPIFQKKIVTVLIAQGKMAEANQLVAEILKENPKDDQAIAMRASLELRAGTREKVLAALNDLQSLVSKNKDNPVLRFEYARALLLNNDLDQARVQLQEAIKLRPDYVLAKLALAQVYVTKGEFPRAVEVANDVLQYDANSLPAKLLRSSAMIGLKEYVQARQELNAILEKNRAGRANRPGG